MFEILEELGVTFGEVLGAVLVFVGFGGSMVLLSKYGFAFIQLLAG